MSMTFRLDPDLRDRMEVAASERGLSLNAFVGRLCAEGMERLIPIDEWSLTREPAPHIGSRQEPSS